MTRVYKTKSNLDLVWQQLDDASGSLYNALDNIQSMSNLSDEIKSTAERVDPTSITMLKNLIEELIEEKK